MKTTKILLCAALSSLTGIVPANSQTIIHNWYPPMTVNISGVFYQNNQVGGVYGTYTKWDMLKFRFTSKDLIRLLNSSGTFTKVLYNVTGVTQIPDGSFLKIDIDQPVMLYWWNEWSIFVTNRNGFSFPLNSIYDPVQGHYYTFLEIYHESWVGSAKFVNATAAGHEIDKAVMHFTFNNGEGTDFELLGVGDFRWTTHPQVSWDSQKTKVAGKIIGGGNAAYNGRAAVIEAKLTAQGSGMVDFQPFQLWWFRNTWYPGLGFPPLER